MSFMIVPYQCAVDIGTPRLLNLVLLFTDSMDGAVAGSRPRDTRGCHQRGALHQALPSALLSHRREQLPHVSASPLLSHYLITIY